MKSNTLEEKNIVMREKEDEEREREREITESIIGEVVEGVAIGVVGEFVVGGWEPLQALQSHLRKVSTEISVLRQDHRAARHEAVNQRLLPHEKGKKTKLTTQRQYHRQENKEKEYMFLVSGI